MARKGTKKPVAIMGRISSVKDSSITIDWSGGAKALRGLLSMLDARQDVEVVFSPACEE